MTQYSFRIIDSKWYCVTRYHQISHTILLPTWPVQVPIEAPLGIEERPENPHAGENEPPEVPEAP